MPMTSLKSVTLAGVVLLALSISTSNSQDSVVGGWTILAPLPDSRTEVSVTTDGTSIFVLGGFGLSGGGVVAPLPVYQYRPSSDSWSHLTELPVGVNHTGLAHVNGSLYIIGGFQGTTFRATNRVMIFDLDALQWREGASMPTARGALAVAVVDGRIHAIGGELANGSDTGAHEVYDPALDQWSIAAAMPSPRNHHAAAVVGNDIVVVAGRDRVTTTLTTTEIYNTTTGTWRTGADVPTGRSGVAAVSFGDSLYLFGGEQFTNRTGTFADSERYHPATDQWLVEAPMPTARHGLGAAAVGEHIFVISGGPEAGFAFSSVNERFTPDAGQN